MARRTTAENPDINVVFSFHYTTPVIIVLIIRSGEETNPSPLSPVNPSFTPLIDSWVSPFLGQWSPLARLADGVVVAGNGVDLTLNGTVPPCERRGSFT